ncbi:type I restriction endonuclease subunit R [Pseudoclavibacter helvolus]|uniref:type I restriction endonuclease subunit R n=1 Tax=Pseudoclavibacter helvolus TaxID=255205 RepID=UPI000837CF0C|nr:type I restriction endonuclease [Pseudoclavibacter helvolus]
MSIHKEDAFEVEICEHLAANGWLHSPNDAGYDRERALFPEDLFAWLRDTQQPQLDKLIKPGASTEVQAQAERQILDRITKHLATDPQNGGGTLGLLRDPLGVTAGGGSAKLSFFQAKPPTELNQQVNERYASNRLRVMRQVRYSTKNGNRIDLVLFVNGLPVSTIELKTDLTQNLQAGLKQYAKDRRPEGEPLLMFGRGALVHFVVTNEEAHMTTRLAGASTYFLPFNRGKNNGAGNPPIPGTSPSAYFWQEILQRETWLDLVGRFMHYRFEEKTDSVTGKKTVSKQVRFPRYHQWRAVTKLEAAVRDEGQGSNYLIQHSAGSGKTDSIAWTAHRMAQLHNADGEKVFDGIIVVSDRQVLDGQLQRAVEQLETTGGVFEAITRGGDAAKSARLAEALLARKQIIGVTLQTFPFALETIEESEGLAGRRYAVIADEAHSSQSGDAAASLKQVLTAGAKGASARDLIDVAKENTAGAATADADAGDASVDAEDVLADVMQRRVGTGSISFFAFTATPKGKTIELFGRPDESGTKQAFDLYSMKQAIEEGFILDVLKNYLPYDLAFKIAHTDSSGTEVEVDTQQAGKELMRWVRLHPTNISQKVAIIVEHFRANVQPELGGRAKAMVVTGSRKEAVRYKLAIDKYLSDRGYAASLGALVAFSGTVTDPESGASEYTETTLNPGLKGRSLEVAFAGDEFQVMIVANKFQTGFDQPMLVGMYVDKKLSGITAVQTLSRLNRTFPGKENTYVLDFVNDPNEILAAFQVYYEDAELTEESDPNVIHEMLSKLRAMRIIDQHDIDGVVHEWLEGKRHNALYSYIKVSRDVFWDRWDAAVADEDAVELARLEEFRGTVNQFVKSYDFLSQIVNYDDTDIEKWAIFLRVYRTPIKRKDTLASAIDTDEIVLKHFQLKKQEQARLRLVDGEAGELSGLKAAGSASPRETKYGLLSEVIDKINDLFAGADIDEVQAVEAANTLMGQVLESDELRSQANANTRVDFEFSPSINVELEDAAYASGAQQNRAFQHLLQSQDWDRVKEMLLAMDMYDKLRERASRDA